MRTNAFAFETGGTEVVFENLSRINIPVCPMSRSSGSGVTVSLLSLQSQLYVTFLQVKRFS